MPTSKIEQLQRTYYALLNKQKFETETLDYGVLSKHLPFIAQLDQYNHSAVSVFDLCKKEHIHLSSNYFEFFDLTQNQMEDNASHDERVHPDDYPKLLQMGIEGFKRLFAMSPASRKDFRVTNEYRLKIKNKYVRVVEQLNVLELDTRQNIWLTLNIINYAADTNLNAPFRSVWQNLRTGEITRWDDDQMPLSIREKEVLRLIYEGLASKQIADKLFISVNTVNNHRQNVIQKLGVANTIEAIHRLERMGAFW
jgi:DNA-binding CsgD family transcriptional regulator